MEAAAVLDASALIAIIRDEPGSDKVVAALGAAQMATVNVAEVVTYFSRLGIGEASARSIIEQFEVEWVPVDLGLAYDAGAMWERTSASGLSLADRICLALARRQGARALTSDRVWAAVASVVGVEVEVIR